ncbi:hypothetical protein SDC9_145333 [bioreactor metagenome]|uniref:Uncharacterized protein n=1 Tax=bioreactor metagenome TaxID=1076179 RepID=A0A645E8P3_9ZZZZ
MYYDYTQTMVQVLSEITFLDLFLKILVCCSNNPHFYIYIFITPHPAQLVFLKNSEYFGLCGKAHIPYLIHKKSTTVCLFELSFMLFDCRCKCSLLMTK